MRTDGLWNVIFPTELQARSQRDGVFNGLSGTIPRGWQVRMRSITDLYHPCAGRCPVLLWVAPPQTEVDDRIGRCGFDQLFEDISPWGPGHCINAPEHFTGFDGIAPTFLFGASNLRSVSLVNIG